MNRDFVDNCSVIFSVNELSCNALCVPVLSTNIPHASPYNACTKKPLFSRENRRLRSATFGTSSSELRAGHDKETSESQKINVLPLANPAKCPGNFSEVRACVTAGTRVSVVCFSVHWWTCHENVTTWRSHVPRVVEQVSCRRNLTRASPLLKPGVIFGDCFNSTVRHSVVVFCAQCTGFFVLITHEF